MKFTEELMKKISAPLSASGESKCKEALNNATAALKNIGYSHTTGEEVRQLFLESNSYFAEMKKGYDGRTIRIFTQGSYANDTNIEKTSDVDLAVVLESTFAMKNPDIFINESVDQVRARYNFSASDDTAMKLKDDVEYALRHYFGDYLVQRNDKSIKVKGNLNRTDCDTVPAIRNRDYSKDITINESNYVKGIKIHADSGEIVINYPEQHIENGVTKNKQTNYNYKKCVRAMKNIRELMRENNYSIPSSISSFGIESLLWNAANLAFTKYSSLRFVFDEVLDDLESRKLFWNNFKEANGIKTLFDNITLNDYIKFFDDLKGFYEYEV